VTEAPAVEATPAFDLHKGWHLNPQVALRDESFGALAYHYGTRRLLFLKSRLLVELVQSLDQFDCAADAIAALIPEPQRSHYGRALARLAASEVIDAA